MQNKNAICTVQFFPMRAEPSHKAEMVNMTLFGELFEVIETADDWHRIALKHDNYIGWIFCRKLHRVSEEFVKRYEQESPIYSLSVGFNIQRKSFHPHFGSRLPLYKDGEYYIGEERHVFDGPWRKPPVSATEEAIMETAKLYSDTPYLWGGRSLLGIDCSGLTQMVFRMNGINLPRDAWQQAEVGVPVKGLDAIRPGDLAFFSEKDKISHVGILTGNGFIIHASDWVRKDMLDEKGIFNNDLGSYTLKVKSIRRIL